jgi:hypothetical protein
MSKTFRPLYNSRTFLKRARHVLKDDVGRKYSVFYVEEDEVTTHAICMNPRYRDMLVIGDEIVLSNNRRYILKRMELLSYGEFKREYKDVFTDEAALRAAFPDTRGSKNVFTCVLEYIEDETFVSKKITREDLSLMRIGQFSRE